MMRPLACHAQTLLGAAPGDVIEVFALPGGHDADVPNLGL